LIVAPVSVLGNWRTEIERFTPDLKVLTLHGPGRKAGQATIAEHDIVLTSYALLERDAQTLLAHEFYYLILDEAQVIKNPRAQVARAARALRSRHRLCLTGTPLENHLGDLWSLFDFLNPGGLGDERQFQRHYRTPIERHGDARRAEALKRRVRPLLLRRTKDQVAQDLPPKMQILKTLALDEPQRDFYDGIRIAMHRRVQEAILRQGLERSRMTILDALLRLRQACCDPRLIGAGCESGSSGSAKLQWLTAALPEMIAEGRRIVVFSQFTAMLELIEAAVRDLAIPYHVLTGETRERTALVASFQAGNVPLFLISLKAGGTGLNLTAADTVIHYDPWWNPAAEMQATDRAHRIGQVRPVFVYKLIAQDTIEEKIMQLQSRKQSLVSLVYCDPEVSRDAEGSPSLSAASLETLFEP
jgi:SNF2 family DNA or RNA helicase